MSIGSGATAAFLALVSVSCVSRSMMSRTERGGVSDERNSRVTAGELSRYADGHSLMEALRRVRPTFLDGRGGRPMVSVDGAAASDQSLLSSIPVSDVFEVRLVKAGSSESMLTIRPNGDIVAGDLLLVLTRRR